jgi:hypothetical protein
LGNTEYDYDYDYAYKKANSPNTKKRIKNTKKFNGFSNVNINNLPYSNNEPNIISFKINEDSDFIILGSKKKFIKFIINFLFICILYKIYYKYRQRNL